MISVFHGRSHVLKLVFAAIASATAFGVSAPAAAGGYYGHVGFHKGYYGGHYYKHGYRHRYHHRRHYHRRHHHGGGGKAAAIALGVIGGAIILNEVAESNARRRAYDARYYDRFDRYDRYSTRAAPRYDRDAFERGYEEGYARGRAAGEPQDLRQDDIDDDALDSRLEGGADFRDDRFAADGGPAPIRFSAAEAYRACMQHARAALGERGFLLAGPATPDTAEDTGAAWKMTATVSAQSNSGESWSRAMYCEADASRVYLLELI